MSLVPEKAYTIKIWAGLNSYLNAEQVIDTCILTLTRRDQVGYTDNYSSQEQLWALYNESTKNWIFR